MSTNSIGDRQAGDLDGRLSRAAAGIDVLITVDEAYSRFVSVQHLVWMLLNLLSRQPEEVRHIALEFPDDIGTALRLGPLVLRGRFRERVLEAASRINPSINTSPGGEQVILVRVGPGELDPGRFSLAVSCDDWSGYVGTQAVDIITDSSNPIGPYVAACLAAGEVFKFARKVKADAGSSPTGLWLNAYTLEVGKTISHSPALPEDILFPSAALAGVGAVGSAFLHVLYALPGWRGHLDVIDGDLEGITETNLNRYALFDLGHVATYHPKASTAVDLFAEITEDLTPFDGTWQEWRELDQPVPEIVVSAVDNNFARHAIQDSMPKTILAAATNELKLQVNYFDGIDPSSACLKCRNAVEATATPDDVIIDRLRALSNEAVIAAAQEMGVDIEDLRTYLSDPKKNCGLISGPSLQRFVANSDSGTWSVGFVSVLAGVLLAAEFLKQANEAWTRMDLPRNMFRFQFWHPASLSANRLTSAGPDASCLCRSSYYQAAVAANASRVIAGHR